jgi:hypothetical protein
VRETAGGRICLKIGNQAVSQLVFPNGKRYMITFVLWCLLFVFSWPLAIMALLCYPIVWLLLIPFRLLGIAVHGVLGLVAAIILLPMRVVRAIA